MSHWDLLPSSLRILIYEFDPTYHKIKKNLMTELLYRTPFWRIKYLRAESTNDNRFENRRKEILYISNYWNTTYRKYHNEGINIRHTEEEFLTDNKPNQYFMIFRDLKLLENYNWIFTDCEVRLIRRNVTTVKKILATHQRRLNFKC